MPATDQSLNLISDIGARLGIEDLQFDEEGHCIFAVDEMPVAIHVRDETWRLMGFVAEIASGEENEELTFSAAQWRSLLSINHVFATDGEYASLTYDDESECVLLIQPLAEHQLEAAQIVALLESFVVRMERIRRYLDSITSGASVANGQTSAVETTPRYDQFV